MLTELIKKVVSIYGENFSNENLIQIAKLNPDIIKKFKCI